MKTGFSETQASFKSASQTARVDTEAWANQHMFCLNCGQAHLTQFEANKPVADFYCDSCGDEYELKSQSKKFGRKVIDGAYSVKMERLASNSSPNLVMLQYDRDQRTVVNLKVVPKFFFVPAIIEKRKPLGPNARRSGWIGSNILLERVPQSGQIPIIQNGSIRKRSLVFEDWQRLQFLETRQFNARGWLLEVMNCIEQIGANEFSLSEVYKYESKLALLFPNNSNIRPKIRQQLQVLRDNEYLHFVGNGIYKLA